jgi:acetyl-CoA carboxylase biotin carboxyl carrier protein
MDLKDIKAIIDLMKKNSISEFEMERQDFKIKLKRTNGHSVEEGQPGPIYVQAPVASHAAGPAVHPALPASAPAAAAAQSSDTEIKSPMVGTIYRAPSPEAANYVEIGTEVNPDTVVCIIEAMKVMNEIKAETRGVITAVLVDNAKPIEFGQALFKIRPT